MTNTATISPRFVNGLHANITYWRQKTSNLSDDNISTVHPEFPNLVRAVQLGASHPATRMETAELMCQAFFWVEQTGQWDNWLPLIDRLLPKIEDETMRCRLYKQQGQLYRSKQQPDAAIAALHESAKYAENIQNDLMLAEAHLHLSAAYLQKRDYAAAKKYAQRARHQLAIMDGVNKQKSAVLFTLGRIALMQGSYIQSEIQLTKAVEIGRNAQPPTQLARILNVLAIALHRQHKYEGSEQAYLEALQIIDGTVSSLDKVRLQLSLGSLYVDMKHLSNAETLFLTAERTLQSMPGQLYWTAMTANNLGNVLLEKGEPVAAEFQLRRSVELRRTLNVHLPLANSCKSWGKALYQLGHFQKAMAAIDEAMSILSEFKDDLWAKELLQECTTLQQTIQSAISR